MGSSCSSSILSDSWNAFNFINTSVDHALIIKAEYQGVTLGLYDGNVDKKRCYMCLLFLDMSRYRETP